MNRIFLTLALTALCFMLATLAVGLMLGDVRDPHDVETQKWATVHRICGIMAAIGMVFVHSIVFTYFVGTSRWCREVVETYRLDPDLWAASARIKRRTFPWVVFSMLSVVGVAALGGASDPAAAMQLEPFPGLAWSTLHFTGALLAIAFIAFAFHVEWEAIQENGAVIAKIMTEVRRIRLEKGLDVESQPAEPAATA
jgi:hypothetical protein